MPWDEVAFSRLGTTETDFPACGVGALMRIGLTLTGLGILLPPLAAGHGAAALLGSWAVSATGLILLAREESWRTGALNGIGLLNLLIAFSVTAAIVMPAHILTDLAIGAGAIAASLAGGLALALGPEKYARTAARVALVVAGLALATIAGLTLAPVAWTIGAGYAFLMLAWSLALLAEPAPVDAPNATFA